MIRTYSFERNTKETKIKGVLTLEGQGKGEIKTGIGFLNHMLELFAFHSGFNLKLVCNGDLDVCPHHSVEDTALALGNALVEALGDKTGIKRYASFYLPMDETLSRTVIDISGRPFHIFHGDFSTPTIGQLPTEMIKHFFYSFAIAAKLTLHQEIFYGENDHHKAESLFKGLGRCLAQAVSVVGASIPSSKGSL